MKTPRLRHVTAVVCLVALGLTGCARADGSAAPAPYDEADLVTALPAATSTVDEVNWGVVEGEPQTLDPTSSANVITPNLCESLLSLQPDFSIEPGVAMRADWTDPVTFTIDLRDDVTFWDGSPVTAEDVKYSLERNMDPESQWYGAFVLIDSIEVTSPDQVVVHFVAPDSTFRAAITGGGGMVMSKAFGERAGSGLGTSAGGLMCTGPYRLGDWIPGSEIDIEANADYRDGPPLTKKIRFRFVTDSSTLANALASGEIDGAYNVSPTFRETLAATDGGRLVVGPSSASLSLGPTNSESAAADPDIRRALSLAIDRDTYITTVLHGLGTKQKSMVAPFVFGGMPESGVYAEGYDSLPDQTVDLDAARELVENAEVDTSKPIRLAVPAGAKEMSLTALIVQDAAKKIGLTVEIDEMQAADFGGLFYNEDLRHDVDLVATTGYIESPEVLGYPMLFSTPPDMGGVFNWSDYGDPRLTELMNTARSTPDPDASAHDFVEAQKIFTHDQLQITLAGAHHLTYLSDDLTGVVTSVAMYSSPWALHLGAAGRES